MKVTRAHRPMTGGRFCRYRIARRLSLCLAVSAMVAGCAHLGPRSVAVDRADYSAAIAESWKQQTLLNIVKLRYMDLPVFVDVSSIVAGYSLQAGVNVGGTESSAKAIQGNFVAAGAQAVYTDRPTITYVPMTGDKFLHGLITPIDPKNIFFMLQSGYAADFILGLTVESLNGVRNRSVAVGAMREADPDFIRVLQLLREVQAAGAVGMRVEVDKGKGQTAVLFFQREDISPETAEKSAEIRRLLKLPADGVKFTLIYSPSRGGPGELAVNSRSLLQIMGAFASYVDVPAPDLLSHSATPALGNTSEDGRPQAVRIYSGKDKPSGAYAAAHYRDTWFWIDDGDWKTKRALTAIMFFFTLGETGAPENLPLITIPAQ
jgi:hypothetical protein